MNKVAVLTTGGTIAGVSHGPPITAPTGQLVRPYTVKLTGKELLDKFDLEHIAKTELLDLGVIDSVNMDFQRMTCFARQIYPYLHRDDVSGVVLTHGTDTMEYTPMALAMMLQNLNKPVVMTGAMLPSDQDEEHVRRHLEDSVRLAAYSSINEVVLCFSGDEQSSFTEAYRGVKVRKIKSRGNNAFQGSTKSIAQVIDGNIKFCERYESIMGEPILMAGAEDVVGLNLTGGSLLNLELYRFERYSS